MSSNGGEEFLFLELFTAQVGGDMASNSSVLDFVLTYLCF